MNNIYIKTISADRFTPYVVFKKMNGIALLESALLEQGKSRYSLILLEEAFRLYSDQTGVTLEENNKKRSLSTKPGELLKFLKEYGNKINLGPIPGELPLPARGIGYLGYESCQFFDEIKITPQRELVNIPEGLFSFGSLFIIFDHYKDDLHVAAIAYHNEPTETLRQRAEAVIERLLDNDFRAYQNDDKQYNSKQIFATPKEEFTAGVKSVKEEITKGNLVQGVLSRVTVFESEIAPLEAYRRLRRENPSPYLFYLNFGRFILFGSSPEIMVQCKGQTTVLKPIAGTRPRGKTLSEDIASEKELLADEKERAEHLMLLDLGRNDLGRTAKPGSVKLASSFDIERYAHVMHIVSEIEAELDQKYDIYDLIKTTFPAGTVSGAPKIKAIEIISALEKTKRGFYAGLVGYFDVNGNFDSCITIRSALYKEGKYYIQSGAGIVYDSDPEKEYLETTNKARATLRALGVNS